jgi:hypothetical protein
LYISRSIKPIPADPELEKMDKNSMAYKYKQRRLSYITCFETATQMICYDIEGATVIERYCDNCALKAG